MSGDGSGGGNRLALSKSTSLTMKEGLNLLGIKVPERM